MNGRQLWYLYNVEHDKVIFPFIEVYLWPLITSTINVDSKENRSIHRPFRLAHFRLPAFHITTIQQANSIIHTNSTSCCTSRLRMHKKQPHCFLRAHSLFDNQTRNMSQNTRTNTENNINDYNGLQQLWYSTFNLVL